MKVGIVGAAGFVGSRVVEWLLLTGAAEPVPIVRSHTAAARIARYGLDVRLADALDAQALAVALDGCTLAFDTVVGSEETILAAPESVLRAAGSAGVERVVYLSSASAYGVPTPVGITDTTPVALDQPPGYGRNKAIAESRIEAVRHEVGVDVTVLRPMIVYGPRSTWFTAEIAADLLTGRACLVDGGVGICNAVFVDNLVGAMWAAATVPEAANDAFVVNDPDRVTWYEFYGSIADAIGVDMDCVTRVSSSSEIAQSLRTPPPKRSALDRVPRTVMTMVPRSVRGRLGRVVRRALAPPRSGSSPQDSIHLTLESFELQVSRGHLGIEKAQKVLGYDPVPFGVGAARTAEWLRAIGYADRAR